MALFRLIAIACLTALLAPAVALRAQPPPDAMDDHGPPPMMRRGGMPGGGDAPGMVIPLMLHGTQLTPEQRARVKALMAENRAQLRTLFRNLQRANEALANRLVGPTPVDAAALQPEVEQVAQARQALMQHGLTVALGLRNVLTPEQLARVTQKRAKLEDLQRQMRQLMRE
jgi:Spy/CpxP family protein refolding chaperone